VEDLSPRQREILEFIIAAIDTNGVVPTYREIGAALGIHSTNGVSDHIKALERKGYLERTGGRGSPRSLRVTGGAMVRMEDESTISVPVLGRIAAGSPLLAQENYEGALRVDSALLPLGGQVFALVVKGDSMIDDGIHDGDYLFVRQKAPRGEPHPAAASQRCDGADLRRTVRGRGGGDRGSRRRLPADLKPGTCRGRVLQTGHVSAAENPTERPVRRRCADLAGEGRSARLSTFGRAAAVRAYRGRPGAR
jgi:repressor LexA